MAVNITRGDAVKWAREYEGPLFHALLTDAPYEMNFMSKNWDASGVAFDPETWKAFSQVLCPGAFLFVFAGTINDDLISVAMRQAGLRKFHKMMGWAYGSGFPKASRIDTQVDKAAGAERKIVGRSSSGNHNPEEWRLTGEYDLTRPATPLAQAWEGHRYGLQALKPAIETILIFQKPYEGKPIDNITETGAGALWIDGGRIEGEYHTRDRDITGGESLFGLGKGGGDFIPASGRWPSNFLLLDEAAARALDEQSGERPGQHSQKRLSYTEDKFFGAHKWKDVEAAYSDSGGASRFFFRVSEQIDEADPVRYCAKASRGEREAGLGDISLKERTTQVRDETKYIDRRDGRGTVEVNAKVQPARNNHPTIKPIQLTEYLATLLLPPSEYAPRRCFVPFAGVGSEMIGAVRAGWEEVEGVELDLTDEYIPIAEARLSYWSKKPKGTKKPKSVIPPQVKDPRQLEFK